MSMCLSRHCHPYAVESQIVKVTGRPSRLCHCRILGSSWDMGNYFAGVRRSPKDTLGFT